MSALTGPFRDCERLYDNHRLDWMSLKGDSLPYRTLARWGRVICN